MLVLALLVGIVVGGNAIDAMPVQKAPVVKTVFKKAIQFSVEEQKAELKQMEIDTVLRQLDNGKDILKRCPTGVTCTKVSQLREVK